MQLKNQDERLSKALARLSNEADFTVFLDWLRDSSREEIELLVNASDTHAIVRQQGFIKCLKQILDAPSIARDIVRSKHS